MPNPPPETTAAAIRELQDTLRPFISHRQDCTYGQTNPDGDYCTCGVRGAVTKANKIAADLLEAQTRQQARMREFVEMLDDRSLDDLKQGIKEGTFVGDPYDAADDCETHLIVTRGELRKALGPSDPPEEGR